jgi:predicted acylesterase/phospholipase RssA
MEIIPLYQGKRKNILVISGGGIKGLSALGALKLLIEEEIIVYPDIFCGTSVGSIICFLLNIGYGPSNIFNVIHEINFSDLINYIDPENIFNDPCFGISVPDSIITIIISFMKNKNIPSNITFKELFKKTNSKLLITGTCISNQSINYFSVDNTPDMKVLLAIKISISIPFVFKPVIYNEKVWVDGACMNNFPIDLFKDKLNDVIGIYLDNTLTNDSEINDIQDYFTRILKCVNKGLDLLKLDFYKKHIILIKTNLNQINWEITNQQKKEMFDIGYKTASDYVKNL